MNTVGDLLRFATPMVSFFFFENALKLLKMMEEKSYAILKITLENFYLPGF